MDWQREDHHFMQTDRSSCKNSLVVHGTPRNFCDYYESFSAESENMNANCANGYCIATSVLVLASKVSTKLFFYEPFVKSTIVVFVMKDLFRENMAWNVFDPSYN